MLDGALASALGAQAGRPQLASAGIGEAVGAAHRVAALADAHGGGPPAFGSAAALQAGRAASPDDGDSARDSAPARFSLAASASPAAAAVVAHLAQRATPGWQRRALVGDAGRATAGGSAWLLQRRGQAEKQE